MDLYQVWQDVRELPKEASHANCGSDWELKGTYKNIGEAVTAREKLNMANYQMKTDFIITKLVTYKTTFEDISDSVHSTVGGDNGTTK